MGTRRDYRVIEGLVPSALLNGNRRHLASLAVDVEDVNAAARLASSASLDRIRRPITAGKVAAN